MFLNEPVVNTITIYLVCKTIILSLVLLYYSLYTKRKKRRQQRRRPEPRRAARPRLILTLKDSDPKNTVNGRHTKTALQQTIEETFSSN